MLFDSLGEMRQISCLESASSSVVMDQHALNAWLLQISYLAIEPLGALVIKYEKCT